MRELKRKCSECRKLTKTVRDSDENADTITQIG